MASVYIINTGNTLNIHTAFKTLLPRSLCKDVSKVEDCDVILAFCPVISRVGTDIEAALQDIPEGKPLVLVVLHQTFDSNCIVPDTRRFLKRADAIIIDCLFTDDGLMGCPRNDDAVQAVTEFLGQHRKPSHSYSYSLVLLCSVLLVLFVHTSNISDETTITNMSNNTNRTKVSQSDKLFMLFYVKYKTKHKCILGVWGMPQCRPLRPKITMDQLINRVKTELELKMQQDKEERKEEIRSLKNENQQLRDLLEQHIKDSVLKTELKMQQEKEERMEEVSSLKKDVQQLRDLLEQHIKDSVLKTELKMQQEKEERMEEVSSLKKEVQQLRDLLEQHIKDPVLKTELKMQQEKEERMEEVSSLKKEVQQLRDLLEQHIKDPVLKTELKMQQEKEERMEEVSSHKKEVQQDCQAIKNSEQGGPEKEEDKSAHPESSQTSETGALNERAEEGKNDETEAKQEATSSGEGPIDSSNHNNNITASDSKDTVIHL
ncbi:probable cyclin-dependent serine/threonine-protein kinase DDB_G0278487 isoform X2 [Clupea harengus]|uniref:Probable cyclin-dependent serine/threonine-protein kinase DDB_G0278487 isoform X2 n=1 Tax=Clupea harengus TaxID=7950 RepID=A0A8M1KP45_CLUHA|nr:probable cyclin-dependent serine/threonine-protein kinase DDB_G0278487 isoform X2 [Clupea harengus]